MHRFHRLAMKIRMLLQRGSQDLRLDDELRFHLDRQIAENLESGMSVEEARAAALRAFGNPTLLRDQTRATWSWGRFESLLLDVRYCARTLWRSPAFAVIAIFIMALGIGANIALLTVVRSVLLKPLPYRDSDRLMMIYERDTPGAYTDPNRLPVDAGSFWEWQKAAQPMAQMAMISPWQDAAVSAEAGRLPEKINLAWCTWNFFPTLGVQPALGRSFAADDDRPGAAATVILTHSFWMRRYGGDPAIVGKSIWLDARPYTVIGVLPASFVYSGAFGGGNLQAWAPVRRDAPADLLSTFGDHEFLVVARLARGTSLAALVSRLDALQKQIKLQHPDPAVHSAVSGRIMLDDTVNNYRTPLYALLAASVCVLLIACMNVAGLLVARAAARGKEQAIRSALGGGRLRLLRERVVESLLLSAAGGGLGWLMAWGALHWFVAARHDMNRVEAIHIDGVVALFTVGAVVFCAIFAGTLTALASGGRQILIALQESSRAHSGAASRTGLRKVLLVAQVGLTVVLLVGAGLLIKSFQRLRSTDIGVPVNNVLTMQFSLPDARYKEPTKRVAFFEQLLARIRALRGAQAGLVSAAPGEGWNGDNLMEIVEHPPLPKGQGLDFMIRGADPGYFAVIGLPILRGRTFTADERLERANVVVISKGAAEQYFPGEDPIGKHIKPVDSNEFPPYEVIGVAGDVRWNIAQPPLPTLYWPIYGNDYSFATIVVRSRQDVESLAMPVEKIVSGLDPDLPVSNVMTLRQAIGKSTIDSEFDSILVLAFAAIALMLAAAGLYGVLAYLVAQRTGEIGIRIALGARREQVLRLMLLDGLRPALFGLALGIAASLAVVQQIKSMLYETDPLDPAVFVVVAAMLLLVAALACLAPAWRASRLDSMQALRTE
jgi:predicted permease